MSIRSQTPAPRGYTLIEVLVSLVVLSVGMLGLAGLQSRVSVAEIEAYQRTQALILLQDMVDRLTANSSALRADISAGTSLAVYQTALNTDVGGTAQSCSGSGAARDLCEWGNMIAGAAEKAADNSNIGALTNGRGCVRQPSASDPYVYMVAVSWQGRIDSKAPPSSVNCGSTGIYTSETKRRVVTATVRITKLL